jgi:hypothetical protein
MVCTGGPAPVSQWPVARSVTTVDVWAMVLMVVLVAIVGLIVKARQ